MPPLDVSLLDVLEQLPRVTIRSNLWLHLTDDGCTHNSEVPPSIYLGRAFRLASRRTRRLTDQLTRRLVLDANEELDEGRQAAQGAFLARQEGLEELTLDDSVGDDQHFIAECLIIKTLLLGGAVCQRLRVLTVDTLLGCTPAVGQAIQHFCPGIQELQVKVSSALSEEFFLALKTCKSLMKVTITSWNADTECAPVLRAVAELTALRTLSLEGCLDIANMPLLAALSRVTHLCTRCLSVEATALQALAAGAALGSMTQLVHLAVPDWESDDAAECERVVNAVAQQLTGLRRLQSLSIGSRAGPQTSFDQGFSALRQLSGLTSLTCPALSQLDHPAGSFPLLQRLHVCGAMRGQALTAMLQPLLPKLPELSFSASLDKDPSVGEADGEGGGRSVGATWMAALALASPPHHPPRVSLTLVREDEEVCLKSAGAACAGLLLPLRKRLTTLRLEGLPQGIWGMVVPMLYMLTHLEKLELSRSALTGTGLVLVVGQLMPWLRQLDVGGCMGVDGISVVALATARVQPLRVRWGGLTGDERLAFQAVARAGVTIEGLPSQLIF